MTDTTIYQTLIDYLNIAGISLAAAFLIVLGLKGLIPKLVFLNFRTVFGVMLVLIGILLIARFLFRFH